MGLQVVGDRVLYVADLRTMPQLPVTGVGMDQYYAEALTKAIATGIITKPGKYGVALDFISNPIRFEIYNILEDEVT